MLAVTPNLYTVDEHVAHAAGLLHRFGVGGVIGVGSLIKDDDVGVAFDRQTAAIAELPVLGEQAVRLAADR